MPRQQSGDLTVILPDGDWLLPLAVTSTEPAPRCSSAAFYTGARGLADRDGSTGRVGTCVHVPDDIGRRRGTRHKCKWKKYEEY